jgi:hypothetical protein
MNARVNNPFSIYALSLAALAAASAPAVASVVSAEQHIFTHTVRISGKTASSTEHIIQQLSDGSWTETGPDVSTDNTGGGWGWGFNGSGLGAFHPGRPTAVGVWNAATNSWTPAPGQTPMVAGPLAAAGVPGGALRPGNNSGQAIRIANAKTVNGTSFVETWNPGTTVTVAMDTSKALFVNSGATVSAPGLSASILTFTPGAITFRINSNSTPLSSEMVTLAGLGINVLGPVGTYVDLTLMATGSSSVYADGQLLTTGTFTPATVSYVLQSIPVTPVAPPASVDLGNISITTPDPAATTTVGPGQTRWFKLSVPSITQDGTGSYIDIDLSGSILSNGNDTMIGLYDEFGRLIVSDDDDGPGYTSALSFGQRTPARPASGDGLPLDGRDGALVPGTYYLSVGAHPMTFGPSAWSVSSASSASGSIQVVIGNNLLVPPSGCGSADFNHDGDVGTDADIDDFFRCLSGSCCPTCGSADFNGDGDLGTDADIASFFSVLGGGPC